MPHSFSYAVSMNLEHSIKEGSHERYPDHFQCFRNIKKIKYPDFQAMTVIAGKDEMEHDRNFLALWKSVWKTTSLLTQRRYSSSRHRYLSMATAGQNTAFHQIQRRYRH